MVIEVSVGVIAAAFVVLVVFLAVVLVRSQKAINQVDKAAFEGQKLMKTANALVADVKEKVDALDVVLRPLAKLNKKLGKGKPVKLGKLEKVSEVVNYAAEGLELVKRLKRKK